MSADRAPASPTEASRATRPDVVTAMTWIVLGLVPVLWIVELTGPDWLNLILRGTWVVLAVGTVLGGGWVWWRRRRAAGNDRARR